MFRYSEVSSTSIVCDEILIIKEIDIAILWRNISLIEILDIELDCLMNSSELVVDIIYAYDKYGAEDSRILCIINSLRDCR